MEIKTVAVLGAGAVGSYIIWGLDKKVKLGGMCDRPSYLAARIECS